MRGIQVRHRAVLRDHPANLGCRCGRKPGGSHAELGLNIDSEGLATRPCKVQGRLQRRGLRLHGATLYEPTGGSRAKARRPSRQKP